MKTPAPAVVSLSLSHRDMAGGTAGQKAGGRAEALTPLSQTLILWGYFAGLFAMVAYRMAGRVLLWIVRSKSRPLRRWLRESHDVVAPFTVGLLRPVVILPIAWREWSAGMRRAVLAHEFAHLRRRDTLVSALAWCVRCLFWFHPFAWWVSRKVSELAELACDVAALERVGDPIEYSRMLLGFAAAVGRAGHRVALPGLAMATSSGIDRRIDSVFELSDEKMRRLARPGVLLAFAGVPVMCLAATVGLGVSGGRRQPPMPATPVAPVQIAQVRPPVVTVPAPPPPAFDAASIRPSTDSGGGGRGEPLAGAPLEFTPGRVISLGGATTRRLIMEAYHLTQYQLSGGPGWLDSEKFELEAKAADAAANESQLRAMLRTLLSQRFRLVVSRETREMPVYALVVAKGGPKLHESKEGEAIPTTGKELEALGVMPPPRVGERLAGQLFNRYTMEEFASELSNDPKFDRPVVDKTGIQGSYLIGLRWYADGDITTAMQEWLGLRLEAQKAQAEVLVIDHIERPSEN